MPDTLTEFHGRPGGIRWKITSDGIYVEGSGIERTDGPPRTVTRAWETYDSVNLWAQEYAVYCELILATMCTETTCNPAARRNEPGWTSDDDTPDKVSIGLMQTLISSTARSVVHRSSIDATWLLVPDHSIQAGAAYIAAQRTHTQLDPPLVACAYNAGGVYDNDGPGNRWKLRQFPIGSGEHCDRFVRWFNDAVAALKQHPIRPRRTIATLLTG